MWGLHDNESPDQLLDFIEQTGVTFPIVAGQYTLGQFSYPQGVGFPYPRDVVVDKNLRVRAIRNSFDAAEMEALVQELLAEDVVR